MEMCSETFLCIHLFQSKRHRKGRKNQSPLDTGEIDLYCTNSPMNKKKEKTKKIGQKLLTNDSFQDTKELRFKATKNST